jgi:hypothetical protein
MVLRTPGTNYERDIKKFDINPGKVNACLPITVFGY